MDTTLVDTILAGLAGALLGSAVAALAGWFLLRRQARLAGQALADLQSQAADRDKRCGDEIRRLRSEHRAELRALESAGAHAFESARLQEWFQTMRAVPWDRDTPEVEVEAKFVFQLLGFLGYDEVDMELRPNVATLEGSKPVTLEADWLVRDESSRPLLVVEVKAPSTPLTEAVREQARSYAFRLTAPAYAITNGLEILIYHLGVVEDTLVLSCPTSELAERWEAIQRAAGKSRLTALRSELAT